ncbi:LapA family protein [Paenibacillus sp. IITD108]|uniref:LapA family protein n=1 Tax=Paenibacillus sp. IITD108 TaxID=3116649 RepID=UPI002F3F6C58
MKGQGMLIAAFAFALLIAIFAVINVEAVQVNFLFAKTTTPLILVILASTLLGGLTVGSFGLLRELKLQRKVKQLEKQLAGINTPADADSYSKPAELDEEQADDRHSALDDEEVIESDADNGSLPNQEPAK